MANELFKFFFNSNNILCKLYIHIYIYINVLCKLYIHEYINEVVRSKRAFFGNLIQVRFKSAFQL